MCDTELNNEGLGGGGAEVCRDDYFKMLKVPWGIGKQSS